MKNRGFTLVELIAVIVILGVLAAVAVPKFIDLESDAEKVAIESLVGSMSTALSLWLVKAAVCGSPYTSPGQIQMYTFLHLDSTPSRSPTCDDFANIANNFPTASPVATMDMHPIKSSLFDNPADDYTFNQGGLPPIDKLIFDTKSGRKVTITLDRQDGKLSWSAIPAY